MKVRTKKRVKVRIKTKTKEKKRKPPKNSPVHRTPGVAKEMRKEMKIISEGGYADFWEIPGMWSLKQLSATNPHCKNVIDSLFALSRDELAARLAWMYTAMLGLTGLERE